MDEQPPALHISVDLDGVDANDPASAAPVTPLSAVSENAPLIRPVSQVLTREAELAMEMVLAEEEEIRQQEEELASARSISQTSTRDADLAMALVLAEEEEVRENERYVQEQAAKANSVPFSAHGFESKLSVPENAGARGSSRAASKADDGARSDASLHVEPLQSPSAESYHLVDSGLVPKATNDATAKKGATQNKIQDDGGKPAIISTSILIDEDTSEGVPNSRKNSLELELGKITMRRGGKYRKSLENMLDPLPSAAAKRGHTVHEYKRTHGGAVSGSVSMHQSLTDIRREVSSRRRHRRKRQSRNVCALCCSSIILRIRKFFRVPSLWQNSLQNISSRFGSGILSYFAISRWLYVLNFTLACVWLSTVVGVGFGSEFLELNENGRPRMEVLIFGKQTGAAAFFSGQGNYSDTFFFYCFYRARMLGQYRMDLAYLFAIALFVVINFLGIVRRMRAEYVRKADASSIAVDEVFPFGVVVFTGWDFGLRTIRSSKGHTFAIATVLKTLITADEVRQKARPKTRREKTIIILRRVFVNLIVFSMLGFSGYAIYQSIQPNPVDLMVKLREKIEALAQTSGTSGDKKTSGSMVTSILISSFNLVFPVVFEKLGEFEQWVDPQWEMRLSLARSYVLKMAGIAIVVVGAQFGKNWETALGQTFYQIFWLNFGITLGTTIIPPILYRLIFREYKPFQITDNILELVYTQCVTWIGTIASPVILVFSVFTGFLTFHAKRVILLSFHEPPRRIYSSTAQSNFFLAFLLLTLLLSVFPIVYALAVYQPSCGPHGPDVFPLGQGRNGTFYQVIPEWVNGLEGLASSLLRFVGSVAFVAPAMGFLMLWVYGLKAVNLKTASRLKVLEEEVAAEREDKRFLLRYYNVQT